MNILEIFKDQLADPDFCDENWTLTPKQLLNDLQNYFGGDYPPFTLEQMNELMDEIEERAQINYNNSLNDSEDRGCHDYHERRG